LGTRYCGYGRFTWPYQGDICVVGIDWTYRHQGNDVALDYPGHEVYDQRIGKITYIRTIMTKAELGFKKEFAKIKEASEKVFLDIAILMGASSKWAPRPKINSTLKFDKPYE